MASLDSEFWILEEQLWNPSGDVQVSSEDSQEAQKQMRQVNS